MDNRIGHWDDDHQVWPERDVLGRVYTRPADVLRLDARTFVVLPAGAPTAVIQAAVQAVQASLNVPPSPRRSRNMQAQESVSVTEATADEEVS